ncbi:MAG TPA: dihydroxy-acid dehydratase [Algoriphagus sp.]|jgi:dihydroxy-acid dehydratase|uniref:IlvD/Edd family dehydratase n=1 Tax=unclassified Algoriphagus TaxID=2641541 RepID=UPI000C3C35DE|nr:MULTISPECIES: IlvD/Edd family dehydratase [unclassified Algoriphagus]MAL12226.1 dihydroxy-acid dehydratase [Algoriphagus sp.]HAS60818.1 dihydroxy-acid dehydratase [Algoriphagus sp.]HCD87312.1 dihydroxy-acid dehydratase [Algoriphagus sp.]HCH44482.1 dihydroxy-acid dehydratase [Algoriphagus sp.]|tara:strand:+ start:9337 stop:11055 length:1719 start_codon:yes stop_codon:yes gene_type:complete
MSKKKLRSQEWYGRTGKDGFIYRSWMKNQGLPHHLFEGEKPVIGICNTWSEFTPCNAHFRELAESLKQGIWEAGGFPLEFPVMSLGECSIKPTAMLFRNLASMDVEESIRANPMDGVVLMCGCDKTTPSLVMGAASVDLPTLVISGGPMLVGRFKGKKIGTSDVWRFAEDYKLGKLSQEEFIEAEAAMSRSRGHCAPMGTASTMAAMVEALGLALPDNATIPAADSRRKVLAHMAGIRIVEMVKEDLKMSKVLTRKAFENSIMVNAAIGGSTNFILHLTAIAKRIGVDIDLTDFDHFSSKIPLIANVQPSGEHWVEDLFYAGGMPAVMKEIESHLHRDCITVNGRTIGENIASAACYDRNLIGTLTNPIKPESGIAVLKGNLCPNGAVIKPSAASPHLLVHKGKALVFENIDEYKARIDSPDLEVDENTVLVMKNVGPKGYPGMPEVGNMGLPAKILEKGIKDMVRISDGRMSGTGYGTVVLHVSPESAIGGPLALVQTGDWIELNVPARSLNLLISEEEFENRRNNFQPTQLPYERGYVNLFLDKVNQAHDGVDFDFLQGSSGSEVKRDSH